MEIRTLIQDDLTDLLNLYSQLNKEDPNIEEDLLEEIWRQTTENKSIKYIGVFLDSLLVSACQMVVVPNLTRGGQPYCLIENVVTNSDYQNKGYGKALLKYTTEMAWRRQCYKVMLMSGRKENAVLNFYKSAGFSADEKTAFIVRA